MESTPNTKPVAMITGASGGIGRALVKRFMLGGYTVVACARELASCNGIGEGLPEHNPDALNLVLYDVTDPKTTKQVFLDIRQKFGRLDVAVNNAGILKDALLGMLDDDTLETVMDTNAVSLIRHMRDQSRLMMRRRSGSIVNVSSVVGIDGNVGQVAYAASKAAIIGATKSAARELAQFGIRVNAVAPGLIDTKMLRSVHPAKITEMKDRVPSKRLGTPEEVAEVVFFLASDAASYVNGQVLRVDGGFSV